MLLGWPTFRVPLLAYFWLIVDRLSGEMPAQVQADLLGAPALIESGLDEPLEPPTGCDLPGFRATGSLMSPQVSDDGLIGCVPGGNVPRQLSGHRRGRPTDPSRDRPNRHTLRPKVADALPLAHRQVAS